MGRAWSDKEVKTLLANYNTATNEDLRSLFPNRTLLSVYKKAYKLGMKKSDEVVFKNKSAARNGEKASNWKGGVSVNKAGYRLLNRPGHHRADSNGYVMEHILVWEEKTGLLVPGNCCVHHLNGIKDDNRIENLCLMEHGAHTVFHHTGIPRSAETKAKLSKIAKDGLRTSRIIRFTKKLM